MPKEKTKATIDQMWLYTVSLLDDESHDPPAVLIHELVDNGVSIDASGHRGDL